MVYSRGTKKYGAMTDEQFKQFLATITEVLNQAKPAATF